MGVESGFEALDRQGAENFAEACRAAGVKRIIYLGGLSDAHATLSPHLRSRLEVGEILRKSGVPTWEFRASIIIGSGSLSFEIILRARGAPADHGDAALGAHARATDRD